MTPSNWDTKAAKAYLEWCAAAGIDVALDDFPHDRFADHAREMADRQAAAVPPPPKPLPTPKVDPEPPAQNQTPDPRGEPGKPAPSSPGATIPNDENVMAAREQARAAPDLETLRAALETFEGCNLRFTAKSLVFADGNPEGRLMLIGEAPGRDEDRQGLPFVGRSGQLLDRMLAAIGLDRNQVYIANVVPWRPPGNRTPSPLETEICRPFIERQIELAAPDVLVFLGGAAAKQLLRTDTGITRLRGRWLSYRAGEREIPAMATLHPAYLLRQPLQKRLSWRDFLAIRARLDEGGGQS